MNWSVNSDSSTTAPQHFIYYDSPSYATGWVVPAPVFEPVVLFRDEPSPGDKITVSGMRKWIHEAQEQVMKKIDEIVMDRLSKLVPLYVDAIRWGRPEESFTGMRCIICGTPAREGEGCEYCGR